MNTKDFSQLKAKVVKDLKEVSGLDGGNFHAFCCKT